MIPTMMRTLYRNGTIPLDTNAKTRIRSTIPTKLELTHSMIPCILHTNLTLNLTIISPETVSMTMVSRKKQSSAQVPEQAHEQGSVLVATAAASTEIHAQILTLPSISPRKETARRNG